MDWTADQSLQRICESFVSMARRKPESTDELVSRLFEENRDSLFRYLVLITRNPATSEELVQESFLRLHREILNGVSVENYRAWLYRVACNLALDHSKAASSGCLTTGDEVACQVPNPEEQFLERERALQLAGAVKNLPAVQQHCLLLRREGFRYREIAKI
ncbi:MAG: RNA polymerase sigma factor, partial [Bryobacteraceae bacterium]|nr:RNA polymerase sigma factor [Bryobacteraceae bacterium]